MTETVVIFRSLTTEEERERERPGRLEKYWTQLLALEKLIFRGDGRYCLIKFYSMQVLDK